MRPGRDVVQRGRTGLRLIASELQVTALRRWRIGLGLHHENLINLRMCPLDQERGGNSCGMNASFRHNLDVAQLARPPCWADF